MIAPSAPAAPTRYEESALEHGLGDEHVTAVAEREAERRLPGFERR